MKTLNVVAAIIKKDNQILATKRGYGEFINMWEFPGGKIEENESKEEALVREIREELEQFRNEAAFDKVTFGSVELGRALQEMNEKEPVESITFVGLCTDICVISNVLLAKAFLPEVRMVVDASCCAGVTPASHKNALEAMKMCQIEIENE